MIKYLFFNNINQKNKPIENLDGEKETLKKQIEDLNNKFISKEELQSALDQIKRESQEIVNNNLNNMNKEINSKIETQSKNNDLKQVNLSINNLKTEQRKEFNSMLEKNSKILDDKIDVMKNDFRLKLEERNKLIDTMSNIIIECRKKIKNYNEEDIKKIMSNIEELQKTQTEYIEKTESISEVESKLDIIEKKIGGLNDRQNGLLNQNVQDIKKMKESIVKIYEPINELQVNIKNINKTMVEYQSTNKDCDVDNKALYNTVYEKLENNVKVLQKNIHAIRLQCNENNNDVKTIDANLNNYANKLLWCIQEISKDKEDISLSLLNLKKSTELLFEIQQEFKEFYTKVNYHLKELQNKNSENIINNNAIELQFKKFKYDFEMKLNELHQLIMSQSSGSSIQVVATVAKEIDEASKCMEERTEELSIQHLPTIEQNINEFVKNKEEMRESSESASDESKFDSNREEELKENRQEPYDESMKLTDDEYKRYRIIKEYFCKHFDLDNNQSLEYKYDFIKYYVKKIGLNISDQAMWQRVGFKIMYMFGMDNQDKWLADQYIPLLKKFNYTDKKSFLTFLFYVFSIIEHFHGLETFIGHICFQYQQAFMSNDGRNGESYVFKAIFDFIIALFKLNDEKNIITEDNIKKIFFLLYPIFYNRNNEENFSFDEDKSKNQYEEFRSQDNHQTFEIKMSNKDFFTQLLWMINFFKKKYTSDMDVFKVNNNESEDIEKNNDKVINKEECDFIKQNCNFSDSFFTPLNNRINRNKYPEAYNYIDLFTIIFKGISHCHMDQLEKEENLFNCLITFFDEGHRDRAFGQSYRNLKLTENPIYKRLDPAIIINEWKCFKQRNKIPSDESILLEEKNNKFLTLDSGKNSLFKNGNLRQIEEI